MTAIIGSLQLNHHQIGVFINGEEIDATAAVFPIAKLLSNHIKIIAKHINLCSKQPLQIAALTQFHFRQ